MNMSDLQTKKIVDISTGKNLGNIIDVELSQDGKIINLIIEQNRNIFSLNKEGDSKIFWDNITKIGEDVILVNKIEK